MQTAVASLLDLPMQEVPHFVAVPENQWWSEFVNWLAGRGLRLTMFEERFHSRMEYRGGFLVSAPLSDAPRDKVLIGNGTAARGYRHCVLWRGGKLVHDPHPSGDGLLDEPDELWLIESLASPAVFSWEATS